MARLITAAVVLFIANVSFAGDLLPIVFEDATATSDSKQVKCDLYYILLGDNGSLERGDLFQLAQRHDDREHYARIATSADACYGHLSDDVGWHGTLFRTYGSSQK